MKDTTRRRRLDLYDKLISLEKSFDKLVSELWRNNAYWFRANYDSIQIRWIIQMAQFITIQWLEMAVAMNEEELDMIHCYLDWREAW